MRVCLSSVCALGKRVYMRTVDPLKLELQTVVKHHMGTRNQT